MIEGVKKSFNKFQSKFSYRKRFIFFGIVYFLFVPPLLYYVLYTTNQFIQSKKIETVGFEYLKQGNSFLSSVLEAEILYFMLIPKQEIYLSELDVAKTEANDHLNKLISLQDSLAIFQGNFGKFFSKHVSIDLGVSSWQSEWTQMTLNQFHAEKTYYGKWVRHLSQRLIENSRTLIVYGNSSFFDHISLRLILDYLIPFQTLITEITMGMEHHLEEMHTSIHKRKEDIWQIMHLLIHKFPEKQHLLQNARANLLMYFEMVEDYFEWIEKHKPYDEIGSLAIRILKANQQINIILLDDLANSAHSIEKYYEGFYWFNLVVFVVVSLFVLLFVYLRVITRHFSSLLRHTKNLSKGQFVKCFCSDNQDDFGKVGRALDALSQTFLAFFLELQDLSLKLSETTHQIVKASEEQESHVSNQEEGIKEIETTTQKIAQDTRRLTETMQKLSVHILQESMADKAKESLDTMRTKIAHLGEASKAIVQFLEGLEGKMKGMETLTTFMTKVSENANLVSLNAAIETATVTRFKESFAAISHKIQRFAQQTVISTQDIRTILQEMTVNVSNVKSYSVSCLKDIEEGADALIQFSAQLSKITRQGKEQLDQFKNFTALMEVQTDGIELMIKSISHWRESAQKNTMTIKDVNKTLVELCGTAQELQNILKLFEKVK